MSVATLRPPDRRIQALGDVMRLDREDRNEALRFYELYGVQAAACTTIEVAHLSCPVVCCQRRLGRVLRARIGKSRQVMTWLELQRAVRYEGTIVLLRDVPILLDGQTACTTFRAYCHLDGWMGIQGADVIRRCPAGLAEQLPAPAQLTLAPI